MVPGEASGGDGGGLHRLPAAARLLRRYGHPAFAATAMAGSAEAAAGVCVGAGGCAGVPRVPATTASCSATPRFAFAREPSAAQHNTRRRQNLVRKCIYFSKMRLFVDLKNIEKAMRSNPYVFDNRCHCFEAMNQRFVLSEPPQ
jgi:hypothetical protein